MEFRYGDNDEGTLASLEQCLLSLELRYKYIGLKTVGHPVTKKKKKTKIQVHAYHLKVGTWAWVCNI